MTETTPESPETDEPAEVTTPDTEDDTEGTEGKEDTEETFTRDYVQKLRDENAKLRVKAKTADTYAERLHTALVSADGRLQDARDLPFDADHLDSPDALTDAISTLLEDRPTLANRRPRGDIGQGQRGQDEPASLLSMLKSRV